MSARCVLPASLCATLSLPLLALAAGCATGNAPVAASPSSSPSRGADAGRTDQVGSLDTVNGTRSPASAAGASAPAAPLPGGEEPTPDKALPELRVEQLGMHIGGGKNDPEEKAPFHRALERQFPAFLGCYRLAEDAWAGGSFGVDLKIPRAGGAPSVEQPRTRIRGAGFQECMVAAFGKVQFEKPKGGPTVISYSILFTLGKNKH